MTGLVRFVTNGIKKINTDFGTNKNTKYSSFVDWGDDDTYIKTRLPFRFACSKGRDFTRKVVMLALHNW